MNKNKQATFPTEGNAAGPVRASNGQTTTKPWWEPWKTGLQLASQLVIAAPLGLPAKVVKVAKYISLALGIWDRVEADHGNESTEKPETDAP